MNAQGCLPSFQPFAQFNETPQARSAERDTGLNVDGGHGALDGLAHMSIPLSIYHPGVPRQKHKHVYIILVHNDNVVHRGSSSNALAVSWVPEGKYTVLVVASTIQLRRSERLVA